MRLELESIEIDFQPRNDTALETIVSLPMHIK